MNKSTQIYFQIYISLPLLYQLLKLSVGEDSLFKEKSCSYVKQFFLKKTKYQVLMKFFVSSVAKNLRTTSNSSNI